MSDQPEKFDFDQALINPSKFFKHPQDILKADLSPKQKYKLLKRWEYDARDMAVCDDENMCPDENIHNQEVDILAEILKALEELDYKDEDENDGAPTKQGS